MSVVDGKRSWFQLEFVMIVLGFCLFSKIVLFFKTCIARAITTAPVLNRSLIHYIMLVLLKCLSSCRDLNTKMFDVSLSEFDNC